MIGNVIAWAELIPKAIYAARQVITANMKLKLSILLLLFLALIAKTNYAATQDIFGYPIYLGLSGGYGSTTWQGLVPSQNDQNSALQISTPTSIKEGGLVWGAFAGYEFIPFFALEGSYLRYPNASVNFSSKSLFSFQNGQTSFTTHTEVMALQAKLMVLIPHTLLRAYSCLGPAGVHRWDAISNLWRLSPNFGVGLSYNFTPRIMGEFGASYTAGWGKSELNPSQDYIPFLYSAFLRLGYRF